MRFQKLDPKDVVLGRGRANALKRQPYVAAIKSSQAGRIELEKGEEPGAVKRLLRSASKEAGVRVRSSWEDDSRSALLWKRVALKEERATPKPASKPATKAQAKRAGSKAPIPIEAHRNSA